MTNQIRNTKSYPHVHAGLWIRERMKIGTLPQRYGLLSKRYQKSSCAERHADARIWLESNQLKDGPVQLFHALWRGHYRMYLPDFNYVARQTSAAGTVTTGYFGLPADDPTLDRLLHLVQDYLNLQCLYYGMNHHAPLWGYRDWFSAGHFCSAPTYLPTENHWWQWIGRDDDGLGLLF